VAELVDGMLDRVDPGGFDLLESVAYPLPVTVICELLGVPVADQHLFGPWSHDVSRLLDGDIDPDALNAGLAAFLHLVGYLTDLFAERRATPRDDLVSALIAVEEEGDRLSEVELMSMVLLLFVAGHETTMNLIGNGTVALLQHRDQWDRLCADPDGLKETAVEELLRFDGPVHVTGRAAAEDVVLNGRPFAKHSQVGLILAAANRDPERFPDPDRLDIGREDNQHLTFSHGIHYCLGAALARLEGQVVFSTLAKRYPDMQLAAPTEDIEYRDHFVLRGLKALPITV
jgi:cytochrome P450